MFPIWWSCSYLCPPLLFLSFQNSLADLDVRSQTTRSNQRICLSDVSMTQIFPDYYSSQTFWSEPSQEHELCEAFFKQLKLYANWEEWVDSHMLDVKLHFWRWKQPTGLNRNSFNKIWINEPNWAISLAFSLGTYRLKLLGADCPHFVLKD